MKWLDSWASPWSLSARKHAAWSWEEPAVKLSVQHPLRKSSSASQSQAEPRVSPPLLDLPAQSPTKGAAGHLGILPILTVSCAGISPLLCFSWNGWGGPGSGAPEILWWPQEPKGTPLLLRTLLSHAWSPSLCLDPRGPKTVPQDGCPCRRAHTFSPTEEKCPAGRLDVSLRRVDRAPERKQKWGQVSKEPFREWRKIRAPG